MMENKEHICCFFGHRKIAETDELITKLRNEIENLIIDNRVNTFLFGSKSQFDDLCYTIVTQLKEKYKHIKRIYIRAEFPYIDDKYKKYLLGKYEDTYYPEKILNAGKAVYVQRNCEMIDNSRFCIVYYNKNYSPPRRRSSNRALSDYQPKSGTAVAYDYAVKKKKEIKNLFGI